MIGSAPFSFQEVNGATGSRLSKYYGAGNGEKKMGQAAAMTDMRILCLDAVGKHRLVDGSCVFAGKPASSQLTPEL